MEYQHPEIDICCYINNLPCDCNDCKKGRADGKKNPKWFHWRVLMCVCEAKGDTCRERGAKPRFIGDLLDIRDKPACRHPLVEFEYYQGCIPVNSVVRVFDTCAHNGLKLPGSRCVE